MIQNKWLLSVALLMFSATLFARIHPVNLRCEYLKDPKGIDMQDPRFYWQLEASENDQWQSAYRLIVSSSRENLARNRGDMYDSGRQQSSETTHIVYKGKPLQPATDYYWKVMVWDKNRRSSPWSEAATFSTGLFTGEDWKGAQWIAWRPQDEWEEAWWQRKEIELQCTEWYLPSYFGARMSMWERHHFHNDNPYDPSPLFRKEFEAKKEIKHAKAFISGIGYYELFINGNRIGDQVLDPGWTDYRKTVLYSTYDITDNLRRGDNVFGVMLGRGNYGMIAVDHWGFYEKGGYIGQPKLICRFLVTYDDGTQEDIVSDLSWKVTAGPVLYDCPHMGELYDATKEVAGWSEPGIDTSQWDNVVAAPSPGGTLTAQLCEPIRVVDTFAPVAFERRGMTWWADAGTNMAGWVRLRVNAPRGTRINIYFGENEDPRDHGQPGGYQQMAYIAKGEKDEWAECRFSYKGFRYIAVVGYPGQLTADDIVFCQVNSDVRAVGSFHSADTTLNAIHRISDKAMISNLHSIPTDCPHREKNGWLGDAVTGIEMGMANYDLAALLTKFTRDMFNTQNEWGGLSTIAPDNQYIRGYSPLWASACVHIPWFMYHYYGDIRLFEQYWDRMMLFVQGVWNHNGAEGLQGIFTDVLADWTSPHGNIGDEGPEVYTTMNFYLVLTRLAEMAEVLGKTEEMAMLRMQAEQVREALYTHCFDYEKGIFGGVRPSGYRQGINAMALHYGVAKPEHREQLLNHLVHDITENRNHHFYGGIFTGYSLWELLPQENHADLTYRVATNDNYPGFAYMLKNGATTLWEHWEDIGSHIHYFQGYVDNFLIRHVAGIDVNYEVPGFREILFAPKFVSGLEYAGANYESIHGKTSIYWKRNEDGFIEAELVIPANCTAQFVLPPREVPYKVYKDGKLLSTNKKDSQTYLHLGSGRHLLTLQ